MIKQCLFVMGTDTDAGKTVTVAALALALAQQGREVLIIKPIQTGCVRNQIDRLVAPDVRVYQDASSTLKIQGKAQVNTHVCVMLETACSPHLAAEREGITLCAKSIVKSIEHEISSSNAEIILIEGAGGALTPLNQTETLMDVFSLLAAKQVDIIFSVLLVVANKLGAINHALLSCQNIRHHGFDILGFVMAQTYKNVEDNTKNNVEKIIQSDNVQCIAKMANIPCLAHTKYKVLLGHSEASKRQEAWNALSRDLENVTIHLQNARQYQNQAHKESQTQILDYDRKHIWHPYASALNLLPVWEALSTQGSHICLKDGRELIDGMASWWCVIHGYNHPVILKALHGQADCMPHVMFGGLTHEPAVRLTEQLLAVAPSNMDRIFFVDSGSVAVEVALKMAIQYQQGIGQDRRNRILSFRGAYHGDTLGAMSVCDPENSMHSLFAGTLPKHLFAPRPDSPFHMPYNPESILAFEEILTKEGDTIAAVILEPIVQGAGGMYFYHPEYLKAVSLLCKKHGCLLIADEIATGFGRTGKYFACEHANIEPDILCVGKGLTGGVLSLAATIVSRKVSEGISNIDSPSQGILMHGPTFMANPLACAVASASISLLANKEWEKNVMEIEHLLYTGLKPCKEMDGVADVRVLGAIGVVQMHQRVNVARLQQFFVDTYQVWIRPFSHLIYIMPAYNMSQHELRTLTTAICSAVEQKKWQ